MEAQPHLNKKMRAVDPHPVSGNVSGNEGKSTSGIHQDQINNEYKDKGLNPQAIPYMFSRALTSVFFFKSHKFEFESHPKGRKPYLFASAH